MTPDAPRAAKALLAKLSAWSVHTHASSGTAEFGGLSEDTDGEGRRRRVSVIEPVESFLVRAAHVDGRAFVAVWMCRLSRPTTSGGKAWSLDTAWRGRRPDEYTPHQVTAKELAEYVATPNLVHRRAA